MQARTRGLLAAVGIIGVLIITFACVLSALAFSGQQGEAYSPLNHFISELGYVGVSRFASVFNGGLIIGAPCLSIFMIGLAFSLKGWMRYLFGLLSVISGIAGMLVGFNPMNNLQVHSQVALLFFLTGGIVVALFSIYIGFGKQTIYPRWIVLIGIASVISFAAFLSLVLPAGATALAALAVERPEIRTITIWEWLILITVLLWLLIVAIYFERNRLVKQIKQKRRLARRF
jgi:Protein of unknown function (DUF998)